MRILPREKLAQINMETLSPMMKQYVLQKEEQPDCLLFFRLGDFYEMFFDDAIVASAELEIALTSRDCGQEERAPMCGVPYHAAESYINKLVQKNYKVAISEQLQDPATTKGLVDRGIVRIVTPGTVTNTDTLDESKHNFLVSIYALDRYFGLAAADISTGDLFCTAIATGATEAKLADELARYQAAELVCNQSFADQIQAELKNSSGVLYSVKPDSYFTQSVHDSRLKKALEENAGIVLWPEAASGLLNYIHETQHSIPGNLKDPLIYQIENFLALDPQCRRHLELTANLRDGKKYGSLLWLMDKTRSAMGQRKLRSWIEQPLLNYSDITHRQEAVAELKERFILRQELREVLSGLHDLARLIGKLSRAQLNARELLTLCSSLEKIPALRQLLADAKSPALVRLLSRMHAFPELCALIRSAISEDAPLSLKDGALIQRGFNKELDELKDLAGGGKRWLLDLEAKEREASGIKNLKLAYNKVFGYYLEVTKSYLNQVPEHFIRKQTLVNAERFVTEELKTMEDSILSAQQRLIQLEYDVFCDVREKVKSEEARLAQSAEAMAEVDALQSLAELADRENYCRPSIDHSERLFVRDGRHPVVERLLPKGSFVPNDCDMNSDERRLAIITGPNMGGKSTYMRQLALIVLMAQMGSFVPAKEAHIGLVDRVFTRIGASDDLGSGDSTFMVEMKELAYILNQATAKSLIILDEIGRGTSTFDGLSIAWATIEYIAEKTQLAARTLFATHFHELTDLSTMNEGIFNAHVTVKQAGEAVFFLHKIEEGGADESYGIEVAKLAGLPSSILNRAKELLATLEAANENKKKLRTKKRQEAMPGEQNLFAVQMQFGRYNEIIDELRALRIEEMSPLDALNRLDALIKEAKKL